jgi:cytochrome c5
MRYCRALPLLVLIPLLCFFSGCDYDRMSEQESVRTYEAKIPEMPARSIPVTGGIAQLRSAHPRKMKNPLPRTEDVIARGKTGYGYFCIMCHGPKADGRGTVGQSFAPLPMDLRSAYVQGQDDGFLFYKISLGFKRHPPLATTVSQEDCWAIIHYMRSL